MKIRKLSTLFCLLVNASWISGQLTVNPPVIDFGYRGHNESPEEKVTITNTGQAPIKVREIKVSCSCMKVEPPRLEAAIPPGGSSEFGVTMSSGRAIGRLEKYIEIYPADSGLQPIRIPVGMRVLEGLVVEPTDLKFDGVVGGQPLTQSVSIKWNPRVKDPKPFAVTDIHVTGARGPTKTGKEHFTTKTAEIPGGKRIEVTLLSTHPEGRISGELEAKIDGRLLVIPIVGEMFRSIKIVPTYFNFSRVSPDDPSSYTKESVLTSVDGRPFKILKITPTVKRASAAGVQLDFEVKPGPNVKEGIEHVIRARISQQGKQAAGDFFGTVLIETDHPEKPQVTLNFFGFFAEAKK